MQNRQISFEINTLNVLIAASVILWVIPFIFQMLLGSSEVYNLFLNLFGAVVPGILGNIFQYWRLVMANFLHAGELHLFLNMLALWQIGQIIRQYYGGRLLFVFYMISGVASSLITVIFAPGISSVGASGAIFGLLGVLLGATLRNNRYGVGINIDQNRLIMIVAYSLAIGLVPGLNINNLAHFGGLAAGVALGYFIDHKSTPNRDRLSKQLEKPLYWLCVGLLVVSAIFAVTNTVFWVISP